MNIQHTLFYFIPSTTQRKEKNKQKKDKFRQQMSTEQHTMEVKISNGVHMSAYDPWAVRLRKATKVKRVIITTDISLPRKAWLEVYDFLKKKVKEEQKKEKKNEKPF